MDFIEEIRGIAKEGADLEGISEKIKGLNPLNGISNKDQAWELIKGNPLLISAFDQKQTERAKTVEENLMNGKVKDVLKAREEELRLELNPEESEAAKLAREFKEYRDSVELEKQTSSLQDLLSDNAKTLDFFDPLLARELAPLGEKANELLERIDSAFKEALNSKLSLEIKSRYDGNRTPKVTVPLSGLSSMSDADLYNVSQTQPDIKTAVLEEIKRRTIQPK